MRLLKPVYAILLVGISLQVQAQQGPTDSINHHRSYFANPQRQVHDLTPHFSILVDSSNKLSIEDIAAGKLDMHFKPLIGENKKIFPYYNYWLKANITPLSRISNWWILIGDSVASDAYHAQNHFINAWFVGNDGKITSHQKTGTHIPFSQKSIKEDPGVNRVFFNASENEEITVYFRLYNEHFEGSISFIQLRDPAVQLPAANFAVLLYVLSAVAMAFSVLAFFFFGFVKERAYLYFAIYALLLALHYLLILHPQIPLASWFFPEHPYLTPVLFSSLATSSFIFFLLFGKFFINLSSLSKKTDKWLNAFLITWGSLILAEAVFNLVTGRGILNRSLVYFGVAVTLIFVIRFAFFKNTLARIFVAGALCLVTFSILGFMNNNGVIHLPFNPWPIGQVGELMIFAAGLAYKVRLNEKAKAEADKIREMDELKTRFFANISHEFRTPLTLIQGPLQQIEEQLTEKQRSAGTVEVPFRQIRTMRRNTDRLLELVNQLLDLSKLDSGRMALQIIKGDLMQLLRALTASFDSLAERKYIHYQVHFPEQTRIAFFDSDKVEKIVVNLVSNAFKYTPEKGTVSVMIETDANRLRIIVEDSGPGISKKELDKIFDRFYRVEGADDKGTGIGLALVKELVELYRGQISVSSEPGKGSRFRVSLPLDRASFREEEFVYGEWQSERTAFVSKVEDVETKIADTTEINPELPLALVVEDNADLRNFIKESVSKYYSVMEAQDGKKGFEMAVSEIPDIVISDVMMPVMDGFALAEKLRHDERTSHIPLILLTAKAGQQHKLEGLKTGADDYLTKPFDAGELLARMQNLVHQRKLLRKKFAGEILLKPAEIAVNSTDETFLEKLMHSIEKNMGEEDFGVEELARDVAMSRSQLHRKLIALTGQAPSMVLRNARLLRAKELLQKKAAIPSEVAFKVGFNSHTYFSKCFKEEFGVSPSEV